MIKNHEMSNYVAHEIKFAYNYMHYGKSRVHFMPWHFIRSANFICRRFIDGKFHCKIFKLL